jgi:hypothetical protein
MNKSYVIVPGALLVVFLGFERNFQQKRAHEETLRTALTDALKAEEEIQRAEKQRLAAADLQKRTADRGRQEQERADKKRREYESMIAQLTAQVDAQTADAENLAREVAALSERLAASRAKKDATEREAFELSRIVSLQRIDRRNAELEIQRSTAVVATRLSEAPWLNPPAASPVPDKMKP